MKKIDRAAAAYKKAAAVQDVTEPGFIKTPDSKTAESGQHSIQSGYTKAAKFLLLVGPDQAADVLKHFSQDEVEKIVREISRVRRIGRNESEKVLREFSYLNKDNTARRAVPAGGVTGGPETAREMLNAAFGSEKGERLFSKVLPFGGRRPFDFMNELEAQQILMVIRNEPPYVMSTVLSFLDPALSSAIISKLPKDSRKEIVLRIARQGEVAPGVISKMEEVFRERIRSQGRTVTEEVDGRSVLAGILSHMPVQEEAAILGCLTDISDGLAEEIKDRIYTIDMIMRLPQKDLQRVLRDFDDGELAVIIKGKPEDIRSAVLDNLSDRRRQTVLDESAYLGEMRRSDVDKATREFLTYLRGLEEQGSLVIPRRKDEYI